MRHMRNEIKIGLLNNEKDHRKGGCSQQDAQYVKAPIKNVDTRKIPFWFLLDISLLYSIDDCF